MERNTIGKRIGELLKEKNMSQKTLAQMANVTEAAISHYLKGDRIPKGAILLNIAKALNVTMEFLLGQEENSTVDEIKIIKSLIERNARNISSQEREKIIEMLYKHKGEI
jgi:transcriptional regulator with XRE-family HTH domain